MTDMPICMGCGASGVVTFGSLCHGCLAAEERADRESDEARETARESRKGFGGKGRGR
jgi:hypothetical protein